MDGFSPIFVEIWPIFDDFWVAVGHWPLAIGHWPLATGHWPAPIHYLDRQAGSFRPKAADPAELPNWPARAARAAPRASDSKDTLGSGLQTPCPLRKGKRTLAFASGNTTILLL